MPGKDLAVDVRGLSKSYTIDHNAVRHSTLAETALDFIKNPLRRQETETFWALQDVSFQVNRGEVVGIIGRNGAGKSTLLKILSRITGPTSGEVHLYGPVGSLLEVGTGFHPELTGRENIFLNGAILGMSRGQIRKHFDDIVNFAEVERFLDTPVKRYSSGMYVRLAFAVAAHLNPEILIIDEVLAVGDAAFQKKCLGKMSEVADQEGRTVLFVSHNMTAVQTLCKRAIWLQKGRVIADDTPGNVLPRYQEEAISVSTERVWNNLDDAPGSDIARLHRVAIVSTDGTPVPNINVRTPLALEIEYWNLKPDVCLNPSVSVVNAMGVEVFSSFPITERVWHGKPFPRGLFRSVCRLPGDLLNDGKYQVNLLLVRDQGTVLSSHEDVLSFNVDDSDELRGDWHGRWPGAVRPVLDWTTELVTENPADATLRPRLDRV